jgi:hypothetical protein
MNQHVTISPEEAADRLAIREVVEAVGGYALRYALEHPRHRE